jgi:hypothetical protein
MSKILLRIAVLTLAVVAFQASANAAPVGEVVSACDRIHDSGGVCTLGIKGNSLVGCTPNVVFTCPADGSRMCSGAANPSGKCNEDGTAAARRQPPRRNFNLRGNALLERLR